MAKTPDKRFIDLAVDEISLVDSPANEKEYVVMKRNDSQEETEMKVNEGQDATTAPAESVEKNTEATETENNSAQNVEAQVVSVEVEKQNDGESVDEQIARVTKMVETIAKSTGAVEEEIEKADGKKKPSMKAQLKEAGLNAEQIKAVSAIITESTAKSDDADDKKDAPTDEAVAKVAGTEEDITAMALDALSMGIQKAKAFTPKRQQALTNAIGELSSLLKELEQPTGAASVGVAVGATAPALPKDVQFEQGVTVAKSTDPVASALAEMTSVVKSIGDDNKKLQERLEAIEKARNPSTSVENEGSTDKKVEKRESMWSNVL